LPSSLALHPDGRIFLAEAGCSRIRVLTPSEERVRTQPAGCITMINQHPDGIIETLAGRAAGEVGGMSGYAGDGGPARDALFNITNEPTVPNFGIDLSPDASLLYIADSRNNCIRVIDLTAEPPTIRLFAGQPGMAGYADGAALEALFNFPINVATDAAGNVYVADARNHVIRRIDAAGQVSTIAGTGQAGFNGDNLAATEAQLDNPGGIVVHPDGRIFIADTNNNRVRVIIP
jgi:sugar lactone lactonase YvrE